MSTDPEKQNAELLNNLGLSDIKDRVSDTTSKIKVKVGEMADTAAKTLYTQRENVAKTLDRAASAAHGVADGIDSTASYVRQQDFASIGKNFVDVCRRYPMLSLGSDWLWDS